MRHRRFRVRNEDAFYHCYNRVAGTCADRPFGRVEKEEFVRLLRHLLRFFTVDVVAYQVMSNHFHLIIYVPSAPPDPAEICERYSAFYPRRPGLDPDSEECLRVGRRMADFSAFMGALQKQFTVWFNRTRPERRRGTLWADRFKNTLLQSGKALWACWAYVEMNAVRAGMATEPGQYRFSSFGAWTGMGKHPFAGSVGVERAFSSLRGMLCISSMDALRRAFQDVFAAERLGSKREQHDNEKMRRRQQEARFLCFHGELTRRCRYWTDGLVIGTETFVRHAVGHMRARTASRHGCLRAATGPTVRNLFSFKSLRPLPN